MGFLQNAATSTGKLLKDTAVGGVGLAKQAARIPQAIADPMGAGAALSGDQ